jgi:N-acetylmuramoyl-L-alanine amidase
MKIFIDPGHGGSDSGAVANGIIEKVINLVVALKLEELLLKCGFDVKLSRTSDVYVGLTERCNMANAWGADYFISVHHNAGGGDGYEVIHSVRAGSGKALAEAIGKEFNKLGQNCRRIYFRESVNYPGHDYYTVIASSNMPAVITEYAFLDTKDVQAVDTVQELQNEAYAIAKAICGYTGIPFAVCNSDLQDAVAFIDTKVDIDVTLWAGNDTAKKAMYVNLLLIKIATAWKNEK